MKKISKTTRSNIVTYAMVILAFVIMQSLIAGGQVSSALKGQLVPICVYICMAISLNLTVGILGELSLGHAGFMSVGAFTGVIAAMSLQTLPAPARLLLAIVIGGIMAAVAGVIVGVPVLRLQLRGCGRSWTPLFRHRLRLFGTGGRHCPHQRPHGCRGH